LDQPPPERDEAHASERDAAQASGVASHDSGRAASAADVRGSGPDEVRHPATEPVSLRQALPVWAYIGLNSFGGPAGQIAVMHRVLVETRRWVSEGRFLHALNYCMLLPGPEAHQLSVYIGWLMHGVRGGLLAGLLFILPGFLAILGLSILYVGHQDRAIVDALFYGLKPAVLVVVVAAVLRVGRRALTSTFHRLVAAASFVAIFFLAVPFPIVILTAGLLGLVRSQRLAAPAATPASHAQPGAGTAPRRADSLVLDDHGVSHRPSSRRTLAVAAVGGALWLGPVALLVAALGAGNVYASQALFFSGAAVVTFGGAYAVLSYVAQQVVQVLGWLTPGEMLDGLALAETTPGPLIMVVEFVGFLAAYRNPGALEPMLAGLLGAVLVTWVTFVPSFLWIFLGGPYAEYLRGSRRLTGALSAITAAVVGAILNLGVWFALHTAFADVETRQVGPLRLTVPDLATLDPLVLALAGLAAVLVLRLRWPILVVLAVSAVAGALLHLVT
jgi:chromate transporter